MTDTELCTGCGICQKDCPTNAIEITDGKANITGSCIDCGHCYALCPNHAITRDYDGTPNNNIGEFLYMRRSTRHYKDIPVTEETIRKIIANSSAYPSATNQKACEITAVTDKKLLKEIRLDVINNLKGKYRLFDYAFFNFTAKIILGSNYRRIIRYKKMFDSMDTEEDRISFDAPCIVFVHADRKKIFIDEDAHYISYNMVLSAFEEGLGSCFMGFIRGYLSRKILKKIDVPSSHNIYSVFTLGVPDISYKRPVPQPIIKHNII